MICIYPRIEKVTREKVKRCNRVVRKWKRTRVINDRIVNELKKIVDEKPELCLDEMAGELRNRIGVCLPFKTVQLATREKCKRSLQVFYDVAQQRDEMEREREMMMP